MEGQKKEAVISSSRAWAYLVLAGFLEIIWATALKMDMPVGPLIIVLIIVFIISFELLIKAVRRLGVGISYAVFTGIGAVGIVIADFVVFHETMSILKLTLVFLLLTFIMGLKFTSDKQGS